MTARAIIDDEGRLFGAVNIIDALVVLFVVAVIVAGVALVFGGDPEPEPDIDSTYATLDLGTQSDASSRRSTRATPTARTTSIH